MALSRTLRFPHAFLFLALIPSGATAFAQDATKDEALAALKEYEGYKKNTNAIVRRAAVEDLGKVNHPLIAEELFSIIKDPDLAVRDAGILGLERQTAPLSIQDMIQRAWHGRNKTERIAVLKAFRRSRPEIAFSAIQEISEAQDWEIRAAAVEVVSFYPENEGRCLGVLLAALKDKEVMIRLTAMDGIGLLNNPRGQEGAMLGVQDDDWRVRASAIRAMRTFRQRLSIQPLIDLLKKEKGRLQDDAVQALIDLTGRDFLGDGDRWQEWWDRVKDGFKLPTREEIEALKKKEEVERATYAKSRNDHGYPPYHGIKTRSRNLLFIIDTSGSMAELVTVNEKDAAAMKEFQALYGDNRVKIDIARKALIDLVDKLPNYARFNIITFNSKVDLWQKTLVSADDGNKSKAIKFLDRLTPASLTSGGNAKLAQTNTFDALNAAFGLLQDQAAADKNSFKTEADTTFFLSDGQPTAGRITQPQTLLDYILTVNKRAKMVIHTISFGAANAPLMSALATQNNGQYVKIGL